MVLIEFYKLNQIIFTQSDIPLTDIHADGTLKHTLTLFDSRKPLAFKQGPVKAVIPSGFPDIIEYVPCICSVPSQIRPQSHEN